MSNDVDEPFRSWYDNGQLMCEWKHKDGVDHGTYRSWYNNGQLMCEDNYKNGVSHGRYRTWERDGQLKHNCYHWEGQELNSKEAYEEQSVLNKSW